MIDDKWLNDLNVQQRQAVVAPLSNTLVLAGAGSGKTRVLVSRIAWLIGSQNISAHDILAVTFTNKAAKEMKMRLSKMLDSSVSGMWVGTFHGLAHRLLLKHHVDVNLPAQFHILDSDDQARMLKRLMQNLNIDTDKWPVKSVQSFINNKKDEGLRAKHIFANDYDVNNKIMLKIYAAYEQACDMAAVVDFAELLLRAHELFRDNQEILAHYRSKFKAILVDEFQDTNTIQYAWIKLLAGSNAHVMAVGDDDQSIYAWRGAKVENIAKFTKDFLNTDVIRLEQNYRSSSTILDAANSLISNNRARMGKNLWTQGFEGKPIVLFAAFNEVEEARFVADSIQKEINNGVALNEIAVLYRSNAQSRVIEEAFLHSGIAYKIYGGMRFYDRAEIKDTIAYIRLIINRHDSEAFERIVNFPTRGIGESLLMHIRSIALNKQLSLWQAAIDVLSSNEITNRASNALNKFITLIDTIDTEIKNAEVDAQVQIIIQRTGLYEYFQKSKNNLAESKLQNLQELVNAAKEFRDNDNELELSPLGAFLAHASLEAGEMQAEDYEQHVHMMTIHAAKGLEFPIVFMVGMEEGLFPSRQSNDDPDKLEEERRLCYVGMTRAMQELILSYAEIRRQYGREEYHRPSRFLRELPEHLIDEVRKRKIHTKSVSTTSIQSINNTALALGTNVSHAKFGSGVVLAVEGCGPSARVQVKFKQNGIKWLVLAYAKLEIDT